MFAAVMVLVVVVVQLVILVEVLAVCQFVPVQLEKNLLVMAKHVWILVNKHQYILNVPLVRVQMLVKSFLQMMNVKRVQLYSGGLVLLVYVLHKLFLHLQDAT